MADEPNEFMKVVHIGHVPLPAEHPDHGRLYSHPGRWVLNLAMAQAANTTIEPCIITQVPGASCDWSATVDGIAVDFVRVPDRWRAATLFQFDKRTLSARALRHDPDLVHAHGTEEAYAMAAQATGKPYVITLQGVFAIINRELPPKLVSRARAVEFLERHTLQKAKHVIAKSDYIGERMAQLFPQLEIHRIPNTFDPRLLALDTTKAPRTACFVGMVTARKGLDLVVEALRKMVEADYPAEFHVIGNRGEGEADYDRRVLSDLRQLLGDRLVLHGILPALEAAKIVAHCEVLVAPSREEMFGNQLIEGLLVGAMPVVTKGTAMAENVARFGRGRIVPQEDADSIAAALTAELRANSAEKNSDMEMARERINEYMGPRTVAKAHEEFYMLVLDNKKSGKRPA
jgi:glycosyltransferase involved in cell wall biosynthesis